MCSFIRKFLEKEKKYCEREPDVIKIIIFAIAHIANATYLKLFDIIIKLQIKLKNELFFLKKGNYKIIIFVGRLFAQFSFKSMKNENK